MMRHRLLAGVCLLAIASPAFAADNAVVITPGSGLTMRSKDTTGAGGPQSMFEIPGDTSGNQLATAPGTPNATFALPIQGVTSGVAIPTSLTSQLPTGTNKIGTVDPATISTWGLAPSTQNSAAPTNGGLALGQFNTSPATITTGNVSPLQLDTNGNLLVNVKAGGGSGGTSSSFGAAFPATGTAIGVQSGSNMIAWPAKAANTVANTDVVPEVAVANALAPGANIAANSSPVVEATDLVNNSTGVIAPATPAGATVQGAATTLYGAQLYNIGSSPAYLKLYNATSATCGSGTPYKRLMIPAASTAANGAGSNISFALGLRFSTGLSYCVTGALPDNDTTALTANTVLVNLDWR